MTNLAKASNGSTHLSKEQLAHREWIGGRVITLLSHYYRPDDPDELTAATGADWVAVLGGLSQQFIAKACVTYLRDNPTRKPTPGAIYDLASGMMVKPRREPEPEPERQRMSADDAKRILAEANVRVDENGQVVGLGK